MAADPLKNFSDEDLQNEMQRRQLAADKERRRKRKEDLKPLVDLGFGADEPIKLTVKELCDKLDELRRTLPDGISDQHRQAAVIGLRGLDSQVRMILPEEEPVMPTTPAGN